MTRTHPSIAGPLLFVCLLAQPCVGCGDDSANGGYASTPAMGNCQPGTQTTCQCVDQTVGQAACGPDGIPGSCNCGAQGSGGAISGTGGIGGTGSTGGMGGTGSAMGSGGTMPTGSPFPAVTDFAADGPFAAVEGSGADCTIHRPGTLGEGGLKHPVILWGNGTSTTPSTYTAILRHWATHGFIVAAANTSNAGTGMEMLACLDWLTGENARAGSPFEGKVALDAVGTSGHSQGGGGSVMAAADARVTASAPLQPYTAGLGFNASSLPKQTAPMFLMSGSNDSFAPLSNQQLIFDGMPAPVFWAILDGADHLASATGNISGYRGPSTAWLRLHLMGDESARSLFYGADCGLCHDPMWTVDTKSIN